MEVVNVSYLGSDGQYQTYSPSDIALINTSLITPNFGTSADYIEYFVKDQAGVVLSSNYYTEKYTIGSNVNAILGTTNVLNLDPEADAKTAGYNRGVINVKYNFLTKWLLSTPDPVNNFWIKEISTSRTEIKVARQDLSNTQLANAFGTFNAALASDTYYPDFYLNFGADVLTIAVNAVYVEENGIGYVIFKLYEPLPLQFDLKSTFWVVTEAANPAEFNVSINVTPEAVKDFSQIKGPNFKVAVKDRVGQTTPFYNYTNLLATSVTSSYQQLQSMLQENGIDINVDYSDFTNFVHFSSATNRLYNFTYKLQLIESASAGILANNTSTAKVILQDQINSTITNFDGYEYYLYFNSASTSWPKQNSSIPYSLYSTTSSQAVNWLGSINTTPTAATMSMYWSSSYYDDQNQNLLLYTAPSYIVEDSSNAPYFLFLNMVGQMYDNIWIYLKDVTNLYAANNNPFVGISLEEVADAIRNTGVQLYTNTSISDNIYYSLLGINQTGSALPVTSSAYSRVVYSSSSLYPLTNQPYLTASLALPPFGEELINRFVTTFITGSANITSSFATLPNSQITGEIYKRIYHNMPYLLKTRGTKRGAQALITAFGVPGDILNVKEYGGYNIYNVAGIQDISNTKILTGSVLNISSSLLSPFTTLQYYQNDQDKSSNTIEIAFSPADSINASITSSGYVTSSTQPGYFNIMQQIGAPALQYSSSYIPLVQLANTYFNAEYTSRYNVWDFIRVIKYYNNSLFKMLRDWVPARASATTGIVIQSHMLERNKYPRHEPTYTLLSGSVSIKMVSVSGSDGGSVIGNTYYTEALPVQMQGSGSAALSGSPGITYLDSTNNIQKYTGEFSGSNIIADYTYFPQTQVSSYIYPWTSSVAPSQHSGNNIIFSTYSLSPTFNNVTGSVLSQRFLDLDFNSSQTAPTNYGLVTQSLSQSLVIGNISQSLQPYSQYAQIQDYNYNLPSTVSIRYSGSYLSGLYYNVYTPASPTYSGDISYGTDPIINYYSNKLGLFTQIATSSFLPGLVNASLAYLADVSGGLFELNQNNKSWVDVQNIFKAGTYLTIKQFDNKKYSNQIATDGVKSIYSSGYNYTPQLYYLSGSDTKTYFQYAGTSSPDSGFTAINSGNSGSNYYISGATSPFYAPNTNGYIYNIFDEKISGTNYTPGNSASASFPSYSPSNTEVLVFNSNFAINVNFTSSGETASFTFDMKKNGTSILTTPVTRTFNSIQSPGTNGTLEVAAASIDGVTYNLVSASLQQGLTPATYSFYYSPSYGPPNFIANVAVPSGPNNVIVAVYELQNPATLEIAGSQLAIAYDPSNLFSGYTAASGYYIPTLIQPASPVDQLSGVLSFDVASGQTSVSPSDIVTFQLHKDTVSTTNYTASLTQGSLTAAVTSVGQGGYPWATASIALNPNGWFIDSVTDDTDMQSTIVFTSDLTQFYQYQQVPAFVSASITYTSSLYTEYGDINSLLDPQYGDKLIIKDYVGITQDLTVVNSSVSGSKLRVSVVPQLVENWKNNPKLIYKLLMLKRYKDEQNIILTFNKNPGATSYGFVIPDTISPQVTDNINTLQANVQSQLLSNQSTLGANGV